MMLLAGMNESKWYLAVCNVELLENYDFADIYNPKSEFIWNFRLLRSLSLAECGSKFFALGQRSPNRLA